jgi:ribose transport system ATP-binding protein
MVSSELPEVLGMSDRILVMRDGQIAGELSAADASQDAVMTMAARDLTAKPAPSPSLPDETER